MKLEIEAANNGYIITVPVSEYTEVEKKYVIEEKDENDKRGEFEAFTKLVDNLSELFGVHNSKHNTIGHINGVCSEYERYDIIEVMEKSLENPKNDTGD
jgi:hypothetical protein